MAISDAVQTLLAAFSFGILLQAAVGVFLIYFNGYASTIFQDGRRLVLVLFLFFTALWALIDFINLLIPTKSSTACQVTLIFSTASDQLARVGLEQFLLWSVGNSSKATAEQLILQAILGIRVVAGGLLVGFTRPQFAPTCVARTSITPISIVAIALDFVIIGVLIIRAVSLGMSRDFRQIRSTIHQEQSKGLSWSVGGFLVWTGTSVVMLLGMSKSLLILRTTLPSIGLLFLVAITAVFSGALLLPKEEQLITPEASSPFVTPSAPSRGLFRNNTDGSPIVGPGYTKSGNLFVVNPSATPRDSPTAFQTNQSDARGLGLTKVEGEVVVRGIGPSEPDQPESRNVPGYRGSSGVFPSMISGSISANNGALAPQIRPSGFDNMRSLPAFPPPVSQQKKSFFNWSKQSSPPTVRSLGISKPVMSDSVDLDSQPFARMPTIDLATAAINERERREGAAARARLVANRPAPRPPLAPQEALRRSVSVKRKEMPGRSSEAMPTIASSGASGLSVNAANGSTSSASLSPGREEVRRRSPRNASSFDQSLSEKDFPKPSLQRKQTTGLPSNPRSNRITMAKNAGMLSEQTVMFMNDIVYDDPGTVKTIINGAPNVHAAAKRLKTSEESPAGSYTTTLKSSGSIIHRPRPYRRDTEKDRALFPSEPSPRHKRSKSGSSITTRKSILMSHPGSPTHLPPLPPPPTSAANLTRLLPNNTKSMTFDEKIELLFPAPPGVNLIQHRRSSVPSLPRVPSVFMADTPLAQSPTEEDQQSRRASKRTTIASFGLQDFTVPANAPKDNNLSIPDRQTYRFSANTYRTLADEVGETWVPGVPSTEASVRKPVEEQPIRDSNTYDTRKSAWTDATTSDESSQDESTTYWGSIHSEIPPVDLSKALRNAKATVIQTQQNTTSRGIPPVPEIDQNDGEVIMTVMMDSERRHPVLADTKRQSFFLDADQSLPGDATPTARIGTWHRRIGDELPTFSERKKSTRSRKMPPPTPLLLNSKGRNATVVVRAAEPSPIDSPERAIKEIQAQLKRFEEPNRGSVGSLIRHIPDTNGADNHDDRFKLLENLEKEMGQQENQWQQMQGNLDRDSMSTIMSPPPPERTVSPTPSRGASRTPPQIVSRRARVRSSMTVRSKSEDSNSTTSTQSSENSRASVWQQRLAEAQMEYLENAPALLRKRSVNFLSISRTQVGSPTPPDSLASGTESESEFETESSSNKEQWSVSASKELPSLWQPPMISPKAAIGRMWNPPYEVAASHPPSDPPAIDVRPKQRLNDSPMPILSGNLWSKPRSVANVRPAIGLWGIKLARPTIVTRRVTQRPQRKSRRVTFLPDIVENPQPLPNKRDTLGIFQFPWGETSDTAVYQPPFNPALLSGPILNAKLEARSRELESEEYSSSFFDDYDDEDPDEEMDSDDDFDETTLWEIANLLQTNDVPSKNSLLPPAREIIEDYDDSTDFESESENQTPAGTLSPTRLPIQPLTTLSKKESKLWASGLTSALEVVKNGLPQPDAQVWQTYVPEQTDIVRSKSQFPETLPTLATTDLWTPTSALSEKEGSYLWSSSAIKEKSVEAVSALMWIPQPQATSTRGSGLYIPDAARPIVRRTEALPAAKGMVKAPRPSMVGILSLSSTKLWSPRSEFQQATEWITKSTASPFAIVTPLWARTSAVEDTTTVGLFVMSARRSIFRTTTSEPAAINMVRKPRTHQAPLDRLRSSQLWNGGDISQDEHHWISESSVRPESPSVYSEASSSGRSSPASDSSSVKSNSTKASSLWGSIGSVAVPAWWDSRSAKRSPEGSAKFPSKLPVGKAPSTPLAPVRESRVLASRDMWEAMAPTIDAPVRKSRKNAAPPPKALVEPLRHPHRAILAFRGNWDEALAQAIEAGKPKKILKRSIVQEADWEAALSLAISLGRPRLQRPRGTTIDGWLAALEEALPKSSDIVYDVSLRHPVFFTSNRLATTDNIHPAALGHFVKAQPHLQRLRGTTPDGWKAALEAAMPKASRNSGVYDVSVRHPVFFTSSFVATTDDIHPAALGSFVKAQNTNNGGMWNSSASSSTQGASSGSLWSKGSVYMREEPAQYTDMKETVRKVSLSRSDDLPVLQSTTFWQPSHKLNSERNWLSSSSATLLPLTWAPPARTTPQIETAVMWTGAETGPQSLPDRFSHLTGENIKKNTPSRAVGLPRLNSNELFEASPLPVPETHWIHKTSAASALTASTGTWTPVSPGIEVQHDALLWAPIKEASTSSADMFAHVKGDNLKKAAGPRLARLPRLNSNELFAPNPNIKSETHWLHTSSQSSTPPTSRSRTWNAPAPTAQPSKSSTHMWQSQRTSSIPSPTLFSNPHAEPWSRKKRSGTEEEVQVVEIESTQLWKHSSELPTSPTSPSHWLVKRRTSKVEFRY